MRPQLFTRALADANADETVIELEICDGSCITYGPESQCESCADLAMRRKLGIIPSWNLRQHRIRNWKHAGLILLALPLVVICAVTGIVFMPAFFGLRALTRIEYDF